MSSCSPSLSANGFVGMNAIVSIAPMLQLVRVVPKIAPSNAAVLITGETGYGEEVIARAIHQDSLRCSRPFVDVNCAALPNHLMESELLGHEKGACSGADCLKQVSAVQLGSGVGRDGEITKTEVGDLAITQSQPKQSRSELS